MLYKQRAASMMKEAQNNILCEIKYKSDTFSGIASVISNCLNVALFSNPYDTPQEFA